MQNSFWFLGAGGRFQEIKQTTRFGNSPKSGTFWPPSTGTQPPPRSGELFVFPEDWDPGHGGGLGWERPPRAGQWGSGCLLRILFPAGSLGQKQGEQAGPGGSPDRAIPQGARRPTGWSRSAGWEHLGQRILHNYAFWVFQKSECNDSWNLVLTVLWPTLELHINKLTQRPPNTGRGVFGFLRHIWIFIFNTLGNSFHYSDFFF